MLVDLAEAGHGMETGLVHTARHLAGVGAGRAGVRDPVPVHDDLPIVAPCPGVALQHAGDPERDVRGALAEGDKREVLADAGFGFGSDEAVHAPTLYRAGRERSMSGPVLDRRAGFRCSAQSS